MSVGLTDADDSTPLHTSSHLGHLETTEILLEICATLNFTNIGYNTSLMLAA